MNFKELRKASGMTQKAFSEYFTIPKRTIEDWDRGVKHPTDYLLDLMEYKLKNDGKLNLGSKSEKDGNTE